MMIDFVFLTLAAMATTSAFGMVVSRNPVSSLMFLVMTFDLRIGAPWARRRWRRRRTSRSEGV